MTKKEQLLKNIDGYINTYRRDDSFNDEERIMVAVYDHILENEALSDSDAMNYVLNRIKTLKAGNPTEQIVAQGLHDSLIKTYPEAVGE